MKLIKQIKTRSGEIRFERWRVLSTPFFDVDMHKFFSDKSESFDKDEHLHNHPQEFWTLILQGGYVEVSKKDIKSPVEVHTRKPGYFGFVNFLCFHQISRLPTGFCRTLIIRKPERREWGFLVDGEVIPNSEYRSFKNKVLTIEK